MTKRCKLLLFLLFDVLLLSGIGLFSQQANAESLVNAPIPLDTRTKSTL